MISFDCTINRPTFSLEAAFDSDAGVTALFGPSGSGKTTIIRLLAGLERPGRGLIRVSNETMVDTAQGVFVRPDRRRIGLVFQDAQLLPHLSVRSNLLYGRYFTPEAERRIELGPVVEVLGIGHLLERPPSTLSGGERQRVAIGRALLTSPRLLLMDEPLASLDASRKLEILPFIEGLRDEFGIPIVYVSHALEEVARLAQRVVRIEAGRVAAIGAPQDVLPAASLTRAVDRFDVLSLLTGEVERYMADYAVTLVRHPAGKIFVPGRVEPPGKTMHIAIRATDVTLAIGRPGNVSVRTALQGRVRSVETDEGPFALCTIELHGGDVVRAYATRLAVDELGLGTDDDVLVMIKAVAISEQGVPGLRTIEGRRG